jgi:6-pyruvoyltetrahydropterin/6-carboxytetrahydropterin synthase
MADGVGIEKFANFCFEVADDYIKESTYGRCWVQKVEVWEHEGNSAIYEKTSPDHVWKS